MRSTESVLVRRFTEPDLESLVLQGQPHEAFVNALVPADRRVAHYADR